MKLTPKSDWWKRHPEMRHYAARQRNDGRWDYTYVRRQRIFPAGYCQAFDEAWPGSGHEAAYDDAYGEALAIRDRYHGDGHATADEARECYKRYLLENRLRFGRTSNQQFRCEVCEEWTQSFAEVGHQVIILCELHSTKQIVQDRMHDVNESWSS